MNWLHIVLFIVLALKCVSKIHVHVFDELYISRSVNINNKCVHNT